MAAPPIHIIIPVWGAAYTRCFVDISLASLLAPGNLPALDRAAGHLIHIFTTASDRDVIEGSSTWRRAQALLDCRIDVMRADLMKSGQPHLTMSNCHREAIALAGERAAATMFYNPDIVLADGGMITLLRLLKQGKRAIQVVGLRLL